MTPAAKNLEGTGPRASIELRTEDGGGEMIISFLDGEDIENLSVTVHTLVYMYTGTGTGTYTCSMG